jgi:hypothetical protein
MFYRSIKAALSKDQKVRHYLKERRAVKPFAPKEAKILVEAYQVPSNEIALDYFLEVYCELFQVEPMAYRMLKHRKFGKLIQGLRFRLSNLRTIGCNSFIYIPFKSNLNLDIADKILKLTKEEIISIRIRDIQFGDLFYDFYLSQSGEHTISHESPNLHDYANEFFQYVEKWFKIFEEYEISATCVSHTVYHFGIPSRISTARGIPSFQVTLEQVHRISEQFPMANYDHRVYREIFKNLSKETQIKGLERAREELQRRFRGESGSDVAYLPAPAYSKEKPTKSVLRESDKHKVLVAAHDFWDSPHVYGENFHTDFYEWLLDLGDIAEVTDYDWYIKIHPFLRGKGESILKDFVSTRPKFTILDRNISHNEIIFSGINVALTVYGSIALEYAMFNIPVINASANGPYANYGFSITPGNLLEYRRTLTTIEKIKFEPDDEKVLEFYFMKFIFNLKCWMLPNYDEYLAEVGGYAKSNSTNAFGVFSNSKLRVPDQILLRTIERFVLSGDPRLDRRHFPIDYELPAF